MAVNRRRRGCDEREVMDARVDDRAKDADEDEEGHGEPTSHGGHVFSTGGCTSSRGAVRSGEDGEPAAFARLEDIEHRRDLLGGVYHIALEADRKDGGAAVFGDDALIAEFVVVRNASDGGIEATELSSERFDECAVLRVVHRLVGRLNDDCLGGGGLAEDLFEGVLRFGGFGTADFEARGEGDLGCGDEAADDNREPDAER